MTDTASMPFPIVDGAFTVPKRGVYCAVAASTYVPPLGDLAITAMQGVASVTVAAADIPRFIDALCRLTGYEPDETARLRAENERLRAATLALAEGAGAAIRRIADPDAATDLSAAVREARAALSSPGS